MSDVRHNGEHLGSRAGAIARDRRQFNEPRPLRAGDGDAAWPTTVEFTETVVLRVDKERLWTSVEELEAEVIELQQQLAAAVGRELEAERVLERAAHDQAQRQAMGERLL